MLLDNVLDTKNRMKLIRELSLHPSWEYSISELEKQTGIHRVRLSSMIKSLYAQNVVKTRQKGKTTLVSINGNVLVKEVLIKLFSKEKSIAEELASKAVNAIKTKKNIVSVAVYGSAVKPSFTFSSDIDLMIIHEGGISEEEIEKAAEKITAQGVTVSYDAITLKEFKQLYSEKEPSITTLVESHKVLYGKKLLEII